MEFGVCCDVVASLCTASYVSKCSIGCPLSFPYLFLCGLFLWAVSVFSVSFPCLFLYGPPSVIQNIMIIGFLKHTSLYIELINRIMTRIKT